VNGDNPGVTYKGQVSDMRALAATFLLMFSMLSPPAHALVLTHGPVVGGVTDVAARVFVRTDSASTVAVRYGTDPALATYSTSAASATMSTGDFTRVIPLSGLAPVTRYYLNVTVNGTPQQTAPYPSFQTFAPADTSADFSFVILTDFMTTKNLTKPVPTFANAAQANPAFAFIGGDFDHRNPGTLTAKRKMFKDLYDVATPFMSAFVNQILYKMPIIHQWDDHDAGKNNIDKTYPDWALSHQAFREYVPSYPLPSVSGIWQEARYGQADLFVLDCRSQRDVETDTDDADKSMVDGNNRGPAGQLQWLEQGLLNSTARWKFVFSSVVANTSTKCPDGWCGYQTEWNAVKDFISQNSITGVILLSGDLHIGGIDDGTHSTYPEMVIPSANGIGSNCSTGPVGSWTEGTYNSCRGYGLVTVLTNPDRVLLQVFNQGGAVVLSHTVN
jgi:alkaline phosphatase D